MFSYQLEITHVIFCIFSSIDIFSMLLQISHKLILNQLKVLSDHLIVTLFRIFSEEFQTLSEIIALILRLSEYIKFVGNDTHVIFHQSIFNQFHEFHVE